MHSDLTGYMDVAQVTLYAFWVFFACLIFYLRREDKREGYPLEYEGGGRRSGVGFPSFPGQKNYALRNGHVAILPNWKNDRRDVALTPMAPWPGSPYIPTGNPMLDGVGPASYSDREDVPEWYFAARRGRQSSTPRAPDSPPKDSRPPRSGWLPPTPAWTPHR